MPRSILGVIGGSGLYQMEGLERIEALSVSTPFGPPSDRITSGELGSCRLLFVPRHGREHRLPPHRVNYRANIAALKQLGAEQVVSISAVGALRDGVHPGDIVLVDQFIDRTRSRPSTFFDEDVVAHVGLADPVDHALLEALYAAAVRSGARVHKGGTYVCIDGPQFSTRAESNLFRSWGATVVGMTNLPEARLAREAELPYASVALVTDYDCWKQSETAVSVDAVLEIMRANVATAQRILREVAGRLPDAAQSPASSALKSALITPPEHISPEAKTRLSFLLQKYVA